MAEDLALGLDSFVFVDDNPAERALMRLALPQVAVPELPEAPELYARCLADAGYFETVSVTAEDAARNARYVANRERRVLASQTPDLDSFLRDLQMTLTVTPFRPADVPRITQLINKTNQFNLTTRRYTEAQVRAFMLDPDMLTFAGRLNDRFGDNGLTSVVICRPAADRASGREIEIDTWLMSCRILGRGVEQAMLAMVAQKASDAGADRLLGRYLPTNRNGLVKDLYARLGFAPRETNDGSGETSWVLPLDPSALPSTDHLQLHYE
jgi:FkbH-like protein